MDGVVRERASEGEAGGGHPISEVLGCRLELLKVTLVRGLLAQARTWTYRTLPSAKHHQHLPLKGASSARRFARIRSTTFSAATCVLERPAPRAACLRPYDCSCSYARERQHAVSHCPNSVPSREIPGWSAGVG